MTYDASELINYKPYDGTNVTFGGGVQGKSVGLGDLVLGNVVIRNVIHVLNLKYKLLSVSQICDMGYSIEFFANEVLLKNDKGT